MTKILVTGGAGFIGSHVVKKLIDHGREVVVLDNFDDFYDPRIKLENIEPLRDFGSFTLVEGDIRDRELLGRILGAESFEIVLHLAARAGVRPSLKLPLLYYDVNINGTINLLEACRASGVTKMIFASSSSVYGNNRKVPFSEEDPVDEPISPYAATKKAGELICYTYHHLYGMDVSCARFFTVYGPGQRPEMAIHSFTRKISEGEEVPVYGDGTTRRDYTHIDDVVGGIEGMMRNMGGYRIYNIGESKTVELNRLIGIIEGALGEKALVRRYPMQPGDVVTTYADISKAKRELGYEPSVDIEDGVREFVKWYSGRTKEKG